MSLADRSKAWIGDARIRRRGYALGAAVCALLSVVPQPYVARAKIVPQDSSSIGLNSMMNALGGQLGSFASLLGGAKQPIDLYLAVSRTPEVSDMVIRSLKLDAPNAYGSARAAQKALKQKIDIHSLTGGMIEVEARTHDPEESEALTRAYGLTGRELDAFVARAEEEVHQSVDLYAFTSVLNRALDADAKVHFIELLWHLAYADGSEHVLPAEYLRVHSPSAEVRGHGKPVLQTGKQHVGLVGAEPAGRYALKLIFDDGHDSGIYSWQYLKQLSEQQNERWQQYLAQLEQANANRDNLIAVKVRY